MSYLLKLLNSCIVGFVQRRLRRRRQSMYEERCELMAKRERRHNEIDELMNDIRHQQDADKMASDSQQ